MNKFFNNLVDFFSDKENTEEPCYDPLHVAAMIVLVLFVISILFWLFWALMVFGGGLQVKISPFLQIIFTSKKAADFGYIGYPYEMGIFEGWVTNLTAFFFCILIFAGIWILVLRHKND